MKRLINSMSLPLLLSLTLTATGAMAQPGGGGGGMMKSMGDMGSMGKDAAAAGEQLKNVDQDSQLRHRVNENDPENAKKVRSEKDGQQGKQSKHQYRYEEKAPGQHMHQSGSMGGGNGGSGSMMGGGGGGGGRR